MDSIQSLSGPHEVYGLRLKGSFEVRYVGLTRKAIRYRRNEHIGRAVNTKSGSPFGLWLTENRDRIEAFAIARCPSREIAQATEKLVIAVCEVTGQRIFNIAHRQSV